MPKDGFFEFSGEKEIVLTCAFEAPREMGYRVWTALLKELRGKA